MQPLSKKLRGPEMTQSQASAPPRGLEMRIASWNLGVPMENSNMGPLKVPTTLHYQEELRKARREQAWTALKYGVLCVIAGRSIMGCRRSVH